jgi:hypothetical protein
VLLELSVHGLSLKVKDHELKAPKAQI